MDHGAGADQRIANLREGADANAIADVHHALEDHVGIDLHVTTADKLPADVDSLRVDQRDAGGHQFGGTAAAQDLLGGGKLRLVVYAEHFVFRLGGDGGDRHLVLHREADDVGEVVLLLGVVRLQPVYPSGQLAGGTGNQPGIDLTDPSLGLRASFSSTIPVIPPRTARRIRP